MFCPFAQSQHFLVITIIFYTCIYIPFLQITNAFKSLLGFVSGTCHDHHQPVRSYDSYEISSWHEEKLCNDIDELLPVSRFDELDLANERIEECCSVCLVEFGNDDEVSQLSGCGHVYHLHCIKTWLELDRFTCPLCRSIVFSSSDASHEKCTGSNTL
ncbi:hypothetical protein C5167_013631 [Papaver somniferum]|uniref:RING-type domain-containing protein n=1 Tax=Papaver somniferum TaxID=3469 RepID=A0A4Y7J2V0_PAPSO|nr:hypothetical protein C5167_013631 [Papaver somniferum]